MNRKLLQSVREYKKQAFIAPVLVALEVLMEVLIPLLMANIIDVGIMNGDMGISSKWEFCWLLWRWSHCSSELRQAGSRGGGCRICKNLRHDIFYKIQDFSFGNIDHFSTSSLVTRLTTDITKRADGIYVFYQNAGQSADHGRAGWIMTATINLEIAFLLLVTIPILEELIFIAKKAHPHLLRYLTNMTY